MLINIVRDLNGGEWVVIRFNVKIMIGDKINVDLRLCQNGSVHVSWVCAVKIVALMF